MLLPVKADSRLYLCRHASTSRASCSPDIAIVFLHVWMYAAILQLFVCLRMAIGVRAKRECRIILCISDFMFALLLWIVRYILG